MLKKYLAAYVQYVYLYHAKYFKRLITALPMHGMACPVIIVTDYAYCFIGTTAETKPPAPNVHSQNMKFCRNSLLFITELSFLHI